MAPVEKAKEAGQAIDQAERILRSLKPPEKKRVVPVKIVQSIERAELAMKGAKSLALEISKTLRIPLPERAVDRKAQMQKLQKMADDFRTKLLELAKQKTGIDTIDKRHRQLIDNTVKGVSAVSAALKKGDLVAANKNFALIKERTEALEKVIATQSELAKRGANPTVIQLSDMALNHFISGKTARANLLLDTCNQFARYQTALEATPTGNWSKMHLLRTAAILGGSPTALSDKDLKAISGKVKEFIAPMVTAQKQISNAVTLERERLMRAVRIGGIPGALKSEAERLVRETAGFKPESVAGMDPGKLGVLSKRFLILKEAIARTKRTRGMTRDLTTRAYLGALKAIEAGYSATANVFLFAAGELFSPSVARNLSRYRVLLGRHVDKLAKAATDKERAAEQARLKKLIGSSISARLLAGAKELGGDAGAMLRKVASPLERADRLTLQQISMAKGVLRSFSKFIGKMKRGRLSASQKKEANSMLGRALGWLVKGRGELGGAQFALAFGYMDRSSTASQKEEFRKLSATLEKNPAAIGSVRLYVRLNNEALRYRRAMRRKSGDERQTIESVLEEIAKLRARIAANGTIALPEDVQANVKSIRAKMAADKNFSKMITGAASRIKGKDEKLDAAVSRFVASTARQAAERKASQVSQIFISIGDSLLSLKGSRYRRKGAVQILRYSLFSAQLGKYGDSNNFRTAAENYMKLRSTRDKDALLRLCSDAYNLQESGQSIFSQTDLRKLNVYGMMARYLPKMSRRQRMNAQAYFDMALIAASRVRNPEEFRVVQDLAATYGALAAVDSRKLSPELKKKRDKAMADLTAELGDYTWLGSKRLADIGAGGREGWQPRPGKIATPIAFALTTGTGPLSLSEKMIGSVDKEVLLASLNKKLGRKPTEAEIVSDVVPRGWKKLSDLAVSCGNYGALLEQIDFDLQYRKMTGALSERYRKHIARRYDREAARLRSASSRAMKRGNATLGEYFDTHSKRVSFQFVLDSAKQAKAMHAKGLELNQQAIKLGMEADGAAKKSMAEVNKRLTELRGMLTPREQARLDAWLKQAGKNEKTIRAIYVYHLRYLAQRDSGRAMVLTEGAKNVMKALRSFDRSVRRVNSRMREDGRMELYAAVKTLTAIQAGKEVDFLGEEVKGGRLTAGLSRVLRNHAGRMLRMGTGRVKAQTRTMWVRNRILRRARKEVRDTNLLKTVQTIRQMISYVKEDEGRADLTKRLNAIVKISDVDERVKKLSDFYKTLADTIPGVIGKDYSGDTSDLSAHNAMDRHKDYKRAVGFAWAEKFRSASRTINRAVWAMDRDTQLVNNRLTHMTLTRTHGQYGYPKSKDKKAEKILEPLRRMLLAKRMIGALPEKERAGFLKRFQSAKTDNQMQSLVSALSKKKTLLGQDMGEMIKKGGVMSYDAERYKKLILEVHEHRLNGKHMLAGIAQTDLESSKRRGMQQERAYLNYVAASYQEINLRNERESLARDHIAGKPKEENKNQKRWRLGQNKVAENYFIKPMSASIDRVSKRWTEVQNAALKDIDAQMESTNGEKLNSTPLFQQTSLIHTKEAQARKIATTIWMFTRPHLQAMPYAKDFRKQTKSFYAIERGRQLKTRVPLQYAWQAHLRYANEGIDLIASVLHKDNAILGTDMLLNNSIIRKYASPSRFLGQSMGHSAIPHKKAELRISDELRRFIGFGTMEFSSYGHGSVRDNAKKKLNLWAQRLIMGTFRQMGVEPDNPYFWEGKKGKYTRFEADDKTRAELDKTMMQMHKDIDRVRAVIAFGTAERGMFIASWSKSETNRFLGAVDERMKLLGKSLVAIHGGRHEDAAKMFAFATSPHMEQPITRAIEDKKRWDKILGYATIVSEIVVSTIAIAVSPVCPAALTVPTAFGIKHIGESVETINYEGWSWGSGLQLGLAVAGTALPFLGEWAAASRFAALTGSTRSVARATRLVQAGKISEEAAAARLAVAEAAAGRLGMAEAAAAAGYRGSKLRAFMRATPEVQKTMLQEAKTLAAEVAKGNISRSAAFGRSARFMEYLTGGPAITRFQKAVHYMGHGMVAAGAGHFVAQLPTMTAAYRRGDVGAFDFFIGAWQSIIQPTVIAGYSMRVGAGAHTGVPKYIPRWKQWLGAVFLGLPIQSRTAHVMARDHARINRVLERIPQTERRVYTNFIEKNGVALDAGAQIKVLQDFISARAKEPSLTFREYYRGQKSSGARQLRVGLLESAFQRVQSGMMRAETPEIQAYVQARRGGMAAEKAAEAVLKAEAAPAVPKEAVRPPEVQGPKKLHKEVGDRVGKMSGRSVTGDSKKYISSIMEHLAVRFGGRDKIPAHMIPKEGATLYDTMKNSAAALKELMVAARERLGFEDNIYVGFLRKHHQSQAGQKLIRSLVKNGRIAKDSQPVGVIAFDGAATWLKNGLGYGGEKYAAHDRTYMGYEMGDLGLLIYMEAARRFQKANPEVYTRLQTAQGDEVIVLIRGDKLGKTAADANKAIASYMDKFRTMLTKVAQEMGIKTDSPLFRSLSDVNAHGGIIGVGKGSTGFSYAGKTHKDLAGALVAIEVDHSFKNLVDRAKTSENRIAAERAVARMKTFISEMMGSKPEAALKPLRVDGVKQESVVDAYATFRVAMEKGLRRNITRLAENNGKGRTHAENGLAGPSVMNQLGHPVTDQLTKHFQDAMAAAFKKAGIADKVTIYTDGPMTFAFKFKGKVSMEVFNAALADAAKSLPKLVAGRGIKGITEATVKSAEVRPQDIKVAKPAERQEIAEKAARDRMKEQILEPLFRYKATRRGAVLRVNAVISNAHLYHGKPALRAAFTDKSGRLLVSEKAMAALEKVGTKKWIRTPEDLISHFRDSGVPQRDIQQFFGLLGFERIVPTARETVTGTRPGARLRGPAPRAKEPVRKAAVAGEIPAKAVSRPKAAVVPPEIARKPVAPKAKPLAPKAKSDLPGAYKAIGKGRSLTEVIAKIKNTEEAALVTRFKESFENNPEYKNADSREKALLAEGFVKRAKSESEFHSALLDNIRKGISLENSIKLAAKLAYPKEPAKGDKKVADLIKRLGKAGIVEDSVAYKASNNEARADIVESELNGRMFDDAYTDMLKASMPKTGKELLAYRKRLDSLPIRERNARLAKLKTIDDAFHDVMANWLPEILKLPASTKTKLLKRLKSEWTDLVRNRNRDQKIEAARKERTPEKLREQERSLIRRLGKDTKALLTAYGEGGLEGRMKVLEKLGIKCSEAYSTERSRLDRSLNKATSDYARQAIRKNIQDVEASMSRFFELALRRGGLLDNLPKIAGKEAKIEAVTYRHGMEGGAYELKIRLADGKSRTLFAKLGSGSAAKLGADIATAGGLVTPEVYSGFSYDTGLTFGKRGGKIRREFHLVEDIRSLEGRKVRMIMPDGKERLVEIQHVMLVKDLSPPVDPGPNATTAEKQAYKDKLEAFMKNTWVKEYYELAGTKDGRQKIFKALNTFMELSRRVQSEDNNIGNLALVWVKDGGTLSPTFQPYDRGANGRAIRLTEGKLDYSLSHTVDYAHGSQAYVRRLSKATNDPNVQKLMGMEPTVVVEGAAAGGLSTQTLYKEMFGSVAIEGFRIKPHSPERLARIRKVLRKHDGQLFGMQTAQGQGWYTAYYGEYRLVTRRDNFVKFRSSAASRVLADANTAARGREFEVKMASALSQALHVGPVTLSPRPARPPPARKPVVPKAKPPAPKPAKAIKPEVAKAEARVKELKLGTTEGLVGFLKNFYSKGPEAKTAAADLKLIRDSGHPAAKILERVMSGRRLPREFSLGNKSFMESFAIGKEAKNYAAEIAGQKVARKPPVPEVKAVMPPRRPPSERKAPKAARVSKPEGSKPAAVVSRAKAKVKPPPPPPGERIAPRPPPVAPEAVRLKSQLGDLVSLRRKGQTEAAASLAKKLMDGFRAKFGKNKEAALREFSALSKDHREVFIAEWRARGFHQEATFFSEYSALSTGKVGKTIEKIHGIKRAQMLEIYHKAANPAVARAKLAELLGIKLGRFGWASRPMDQRDYVSPSYRRFNSMSEDNFFFGMLLSGNLPDHVQNVVSSLYKGKVSGRIKSVEFFNGSVGAYEVRVAVWRAGKRPVEKVLYLKRMDLRPDRSGAAHSEISGVPAPKIHTSTKTGDMVYTMPDGTRSRFGFLENMGDYQGSMKVGRKTYETSALAEMSIFDAAQIYRAVQAGNYDQVAANYTKQQLNLYKDVMAMLRSADPKTRALFWRELGHNLAASYTTGLWDRHEVNLRVMRIEVMGKVTKRDLKAFTKAGYHVKKEDGKTILFRIGNIDTDATASFRAQQVRGKTDFSHHSARFGQVDLPRLFDTLSNLTGRPVDSLVKEAFGSSIWVRREADGSIKGRGTKFDGAMLAGAKRFWKQFGSKPEFRKAFEKTLTGTAGEPMGFPFMLKPAEVETVRKYGMVHWNEPMFGDPFTMITHTDGRMTNRPIYEVSYGESLPKAVAEKFPPRTDMYVFELTGASRQALGKTPDTIQVKDPSGKVVRTVAIVKASDITPAIAAALKKSGVKLIKARRDIPPADFAAKRPELSKETFTLGVIRSDSGFSALTGIAAQYAGSVPYFRALANNPKVVDSNFAYIGFLILYTKLQKPPPPGAPKPGARKAPSKEKVPIVKAVQPPREAPRPRAARPAARVSRPEAPGPAAVVSRRVPRRQATPPELRPRAGVIEAPPKPVPRTAKEPKVVVRKMSLAWDEAVRILGTPGEPHPQLRDAQASFLKMNRGEQMRALQQLRKWASVHQKNGRITDMQQLRRQAARLGDLMELTGLVGQNLETLYGLRKGELQDIYSKAGSLEKAREAVCKKLNIEVSYYGDDSIFGIIFSGDLVRVIAERYKNFKSLSIEFIGEGTTGAYRLTVMDQNGRPTVSYLKKVDMRPDRSGADNFLSSSIPAPRTITTDLTGRALMYRKPDGTFSAYGIQESLTRFSGTLMRSGVRLDVDTYRSASLGDMSRSSQLMDVFVKHPELFWREWGYMQAAGWALGSIDGHAGNAFGMMLRIKNATPKVLAKLKAAGETVFTGPKGEKLLFTMGRIDTDDAGGTYWAFGKKGKFNFLEAKVRNASHFVFPETFKSLVYLRNAYETSLAAAEGRQPRLMTIPDLIKEAFGTGGQGPVYAGIRKWAKQHTNNPDYRKAVIDGMYRRVGEPVGVSSFSAGLLDPARRRQFMSDGVTYFEGTPNNGEANSPVFYRDGRTMAMPPYYDFVSGVNGWPAHVQNLFPHGQRSWVVPVSEARSTGMSNIFLMGNRRFAVFSSRSSIPGDLRPGAMWALRVHDNIRAQDGFGRATGVKADQVGAGHVFDFIMNKGENGMVGEFRSMQNMLELWARESGDIHIRDTESP